MASAKWPHDLNQADEPAQHRRSSSVDSGLQSTWALSGLRKSSREETFDLHLHCSTFEFREGCHTVCHLIVTLCGRQGRSYWSHFVNGKPEAQKVWWLVWGHTESSQQRECGASGSPGEAEGPRGWDRVGTW